MIVNTDNGEILDLSALRRQPRGPKTSRLNVQQRQQNETLWLITGLSLLVAAVSIAL
jgi:hypothetical protein